MPSPIVLFVYDRPEHTLQTLEALKNNDGANESILYIYADGPKDNASTKNIEKIEETRRILKQSKWCKEVHIIERTSNIGLAANIIDGVTTVVNKHEQVIVLEDDIVTSKGFLNYMNDALQFYKDHKEVMHISGFMYPHKETLPETFFFKVALCWGWATWKSSWNHFNTSAIDLWREIKDKNLLQEVDQFGSDYLSSQLAHNISGRLNTWFVKWHVSVILQGGYTLYPSVSLVNNIGFDNTGVHNGATDDFENKILAPTIAVKEITIEENKTAARSIVEFYKKNRTKPLQKKNLKKKIRTFIRRVGFKFFPELKNAKTTTVITSSIQSYLGKNVKLYPDYKLNNTIIGNYTYVSYNATINNTIIGKYCSIGPNLISGWGIHPVDGISTHPMFYSTKKQNGISLSKTDKIQETSPIYIGNDVFIGMNVTILDGVTIGDGAVIGAGAVVSKDIPPYAIAVGNPIKVVKYRFEDAIIENLLKSKWWDFRDSKINLVEKHFFDVETFIKNIDT
ncbi:DapH/DapD/GlmU-related protein [uncultured Dokdonia sp.]|uniref:DapH/DapD/GlmU-related protein n=1 Tax=uncultured Dokdonia sp. TaxID=575653 RepID=UPI0026065EC1|nr:DapH/DapD/GlmU-related protein [uncultured Dokdonia sp.]